MKGRGRRRALFLAGFAAYFAALWLLWDTVAIYPLKVFVVFLHEISHGLAAVATGGSIQAITLNPRLGGACHCPGGNAFLTLSAGYLGSLGWGALLLEGARGAGSRAARATSGAGAGVIVLTLLFVRGVFGILFGVAFGGSLMLAARHLAGSTNRTILTVLGLTSCLYAILDIKGDVLDRPYLRSDASMLAELTGIPTAVWGMGWIAVAVATSAWLFVRAYRKA